MSPKVVNYSFRSVIGWNRTKRSDEPVDLEVMIDWAGLTRLLATNCVTSKGGRSQLLKGIVKSRIKR